MLHGYTKQITDGQVKVANTKNCLPGLSGSNTLGHGACFMLPSLILQGKNSGKSNPILEHSFNVRHISELIEFLTVEMYIYSLSAPLQTVFVV